MIFGYSCFLLMEKYISFQHEYLKINNFKLIFNGKLRKIV